MNFLKAFSFSAVIALAMTACVNMNYIGQRYEPTDKAEILSSSPSGKYRMIGKVTLTAPDGYTSEEMKEDLIAKAKSVGADAVEIVSAKREATGQYSIPKGNKPGFQPQGNWDKNVYRADGSRISTNSFGQTGVGKDETVTQYQTQVRAYFYRLKSKPEPSGKKEEKKK